MLNGKSIKVAPRPAGFPFKKIFAGHFWICQPLMNVNPGWSMVMVPSVPIVQKATEMASPPKKQPRVD